jgi:hypothetical protein
MKEPRLRGALFRQRLLRAFDLSGFFSLGRLRNIELDPIAFIERALAFTDDFLEVSEHIATTIFFFDEAVAFSTIKPLHFTEWHFCLLSSLDLFIGL